MPSSRAAPLPIRRMDLWSNRTSLPSSRLVPRGLFCSCVVIIRLERGGTTGVRVDTCNGNGNAGKQGSILLT